MSTETMEPPAARIESTNPADWNVPAGWTRKHLLGLENLSAEELTIALDTAARFKRATSGCSQKLPLLVGRTIANLFFENSTRTRTSFSLAARRLGADTVDFSASGSSLSKGETVIDTAKNIEAMGVHCVVVRHKTPGTAELLAKNLGSSVINAGDGAHEHPTQGLLDIMSIRERPWECRGFDSRTRRRHRAQPHGTLQHLGSEETRCACHCLWSFNAGFQGVGKTGRRSGVQLGRHLAAMRRVKSPAYSV